MSISIFAQLFERIVCRYWLAFGLLIFLIGFFIAPSQHHYKLLATDLLLLPALLAVFAPKHWVKLWRNCRAIALIGLYLLYFTLNELHHQTEDAAEYIQWSIYLLLFLFALSSRLIVTEHRLGQLLLIATLAAAAAALFAIAYDLKTGIFRQPDYRLIGYGALYNPLRSAEVFGAFAVIGISLSIHIESATARTFAFGAAIICFIATVFTGSRSPLLGQLAVGLYVIAFQIDHRQRLRWILTISAICVFVLAVFWQELSTRGTSLRPEIWSYVWQLCQQHPWLGQGLNHRAEIPTSSGAIFTDTHNLFLNALYAGGVIGFALLVAVFGTFGHLAWQRRHLMLCNLAISLLIYSFITLQFDGGSLLGRPGEFWLLLWLPIALCMRTLNDEQSHNVA